MYKRLLDKLRKFFRYQQNGQVLSPFQERLKKSRKVIRSLKAQADARRTFPEKLADWMTATFGSITFLLINLIIFTWWVLVNTHTFPTVEPFDPFPFSLLTTIVSLEAIILAVFVLISQNREQRVNHLREEIDFQVDLISESELTKLMEIVGKIAKKQGIDLSKDVEFQEMRKPLNRDKIQTALEKEIL